MTERDKHLYEIARGLALNWRDMLQAARSRRPWRCRREVLKWGEANTKMITELASVLQGGKIGDMLK